MCRFCETQDVQIPAEGYEDAGHANTMASMVSRMFGQSDGNGIKIVKGNMLWFDNSSGEYNAGLIAIDYCPLCGRDLTK